MIPCLKVTWVGTTLAQCVEVEGEGIKLRGQRDCKRVCVHVSSTYPPIKSFPVSLITLKKKHYTIVAKYSLQVEFIELWLIRFSDP